MAQHYDAISIHAPRTGSDAFARVSRKDSAQFQSTLPARGATGKRDVIRRALEISIHAPRTGSDVNEPSRRESELHFNPRSPHGERRQRTVAARIGITFQSTLPARGATGANADFLAKVVISIHAPRTASDSTAADAGRDGHPFQSTLPARGATHEYAGRLYILPFQSTLPARGATSPTSRKHAGRWISIHAPRTGSDRPCDPDVRIRQISIHAPRTGSDPHEFTANRFFHVISIHAPRTGSDRSPPAGCARREAFQSTLPARGATRSGASLPAHKRYFNPRSPHGERQSTSRRFPSG